MRAIPTYIYERRITQGNAVATPITPSQLQFIETQQRLGFPCASDFTFSLSSPNFSTEQTINGALYQCTFSLEFTGEIKAKNAITQSSFNASQKALTLKFKTIAAQYFANLQLQSFSQIHHKAVIGSQGTGEYTSTSMSAEAANRYMITFQNQAIDKNHTEFNNYEINGNFNAVLVISIIPKAPPPSAPGVFNNMAKHVQIYLQYMGILAFDPNSALLTDAHLNSLLFNYHQANLNRENIQLPQTQLTSSILNSACMVLVFTLLVIG